eukprot:CAMPEP_0170506386 /NCGR_PEP_ID=MMETSP0208-20121228/54658_1 /TAXON_ID=197538 /ORGANISM="Strombidium inclinatum, Strain S3" /LENGTH=171 /DNA_ID=CAMNT_0010787863 /DNA_START=1863 /DNA_END=2378 /DNA_ORIENTATION=-
MRRRAGLASVHASGVVLVVGLGAVGLARDELELGLKLGLPPRAVEEAVSISLVRVRSPCRFATVSAELLLRRLAPVDVAPLNGHRVQPQGLLFLEGGFEFALAILSEEAGVHHVQSLLVVDLRRMLLIEGVHFTMHRALEVVASALLRFIILSLELVDLLGHLPEQVLLFI